MLELVIGVSLGPKGANNTSREEMFVSLPWFGSGLEPLWIIININSPFSSSLVSLEKTHQPRTFLGGYGIEERRNLIRIEAGSCSLPSIAFYFYGNI